MHDPRTPRQVPSASTLPIWPVNPDGSCTCGRDACGDAGKHPCVHRGHLDGGGYGILCGEIGPKGSGIFVVDCDEKPGVSGLENFRALCLANGMDIPDTLIVRTGGGGFHFYFLAPSFRTKNSVGKLAKGVDVRGDGGWVVGPGSMHRNGHAYYVIHDAPIVHAPEWLLAWPGLQAHGPVPYDSSDTQGWTPPAVDVSTSEGQRRLEAFRSEARGDTGDLEPSISGQGGDNALYRAAKRGTCYWLLPAETVVQVLVEDFNPRGEAPEGDLEGPYWEVDWIRRKVHEAIRTNRELTPGPIPLGWGQRLARAAIIGDMEVSSPDARAPDAKHEYQLDVSNCVAIGELEQASHSSIIFRLCKSREWAGVLQWDEFADMVLAVNPPVKLDAEKHGIGLTDADVERIRVWFEVVANVTGALETFRACVDVAAKACPIHPVRDYLLGLPAGDPGVFDGLAARWFGAKGWEGGDLLDDELLKRFLVAAVRRILTPGEQVDTMLILYSRGQGRKKTQWVRTMFGHDWSSQQMPDLGNKDASQQIATVWGQEIGELDKLLRIDQSTAKDFISRCVDRYRPAYGRSIVVKPRQCVFIGTTNETEFLRDPTGERRYWPITVLQTIDLEMVASMRDVVWAAAVALAMRPDFEHWIDEGSALDELLKARQAVHSQEDAWQTSIYDYCCGRKHVTGQEVFATVVMRGSPEWIEKWDRKAQNRISETLRQMGAHKTVVQVEGKSVKCYALPHGLARAIPSDQELKRRKAQDQYGQAKLTLLQGGKSDAGAKDVQGGGA